jgi:hypothetical protein
MIKSGAVYIKDDADTLYELVTHEKYTECHRVSDWVPINMEQMSQFTRAFCQIQVTISDPSRN